MRIVYPSLSLLPNCETPWSTFIFGGYFLYFDKSHCERRNELTR